MLELRLRQGSLLKVAFEVIGDFVDDANFHFFADGVSLQDMTDNDMAVVMLNLKPEIFDVYRCDGDISLEMNITNVCKMLNCAGDDDLITISADEHSDIIPVMFESPTRDKITDFQMKLKTVEIREPWFPEIEFQASIRMRSALFARICRDHRIIGDTVSISATEGAVKFTTEGAIGPVNTVCRHNPVVDNPEEAIIIETREPISLTFELGYLNSITKATPLSDAVTIHLYKHEFVSVEYMITERSNMMFYLFRLKTDEVKTH